MIHIRQNLGCIGDLIIDIPWLVRILKDFFNSFTFILPCFLLRHLKITLQAKDALHSLLIFTRHCKISLTFPPQNRIQIDKTCYSFKEWPHFFVIPCPVKSSRKLKLFLRLREDLSQRRFSKCITMGELFRSNFEPANHGSVFFVEKSFLCCCNE